MAMTSSVLFEPRPNMVAHSHLSKKLVEDTGLMSWAVYVANISAPTAAKMVEQTERSITSAKKQTAYGIAMGTDLSTFDHTSASPKLTAQFAGYMKSMSMSDAYSIQHLVDGFDWPSLKEGLVVDASFLPLV